MSEIELKFLIDAPLARTLWEHAREAGLTAARQPAPRKLHSVYFDTADRALKKAGMVLRLRRDGRRWIQTVKAGRALHGGLSNVEEIENPARGGRIDVAAIPDPAMRAIVEETVAGAPLGPVCETVIRRASAPLQLDGASAELAVDVGEIMAAGRSATLHEAEIELVDGDPKSLFDMAKLLFPRGGVRFSRLPKSARAELLAAEGHIEPPLRPRGALPVPLEGSATVEEAARDILRECADQVASNMVVVMELDDAEGPHQLRVGLRRLRSALRLFADVFGGPDLERLTGEARWLGQEVGAQRDLDVVATEIARPEAQKHPEEPSLARLADALDRAAIERRHLLREQLRGTRAQAFVLDLVRFVETRGWLDPTDTSQSARLAAPVGELAATALAKRWKKVRKAARDIDTLDIEQRHALRKELKKLRYAVEFLSPLFGEKRVATFLKRLKNLQTVFGSLNDAAVVKAMFAGPAAPLPPEAQADPAVQRAIGWLVGASQARVEPGWEDARKLWKELDEAKPFWN